MVEENDVRRILGVSHVGVIPARNPLSAFPNKVFTYLSGSLPVISALQGEFARLVDTERIGVNIPAGDIGALADAIVRYAENPTERKDAGERVRALFEAKFDARRIDVDYADHVEMIAQNARLRPSRLKENRRD